MKINNLYLMIVCGFYACQGGQEIEISIDDVSQQHLIVSENRIDSVTEPMNISLYKDCFIIRQNRFPINLFNFYNRHDFTYLFSTGEKGHTNNEFIMPDKHYFYSTDSSFFILDTQVEKEIKLLGKKLKTINMTPIATFDAINQMVKLEDGKYIMSGRTSQSNAEHILYENGSIKEFGKYPMHINEQDFVYNFKFTVGRPDRKLIWDFYLYQNRIRGYDKQGNLIKDIILRTPKQHEMSLDISKIQTCYTMVTCNQQCIYALYDYVTKTGDIEKEIQQWNWDGELLGRFLFPYTAHSIAVSSEGEIYAINCYLSNMVYTCNIK